jgi:predicted aspartyl protease
MDRFANFIRRTGAALLVAGVFAGCSITSSPIEANIEKQLLKTKLSEGEFGARVANQGERIHFTMFTGYVHPAPVVVPMSKRFRGLPGLDVRLNDRHTVRMLADTGAQLSIVDAASVLAAGGRAYVPEKWNFSVTGIGGSEQAWLARFDRASIDSVTLRSFTTVVRRHRTVVRMGGMSVGAIPINLLGCPVLLGFRYVTFDYAAQRFVFSPGTSFTPSPRASRVPLTVKDQLIYVPLRIGGRTMSAMVDTGAKDQIFLNTQTVRAFGLQDRVKTGGTYRALGLGGETSGRQFTVPLAFLGNVPLQNVVIDTSDSESWDVRIGSDLLERWKVTFDFQNRAMWLEPPTL